jgi:hypothetical protein
MWRLSESFEKAVLDRGTSKEAGNHTVSLCVLLD